MRQILSFFKLLVLSLLLSHCSGVSHDDQLNDLFEQDWQYTMKRSPLFATRVGDHRYNDCLNVESIEQESKDHEQVKKILDQLALIDITSLSESQKLNYEIFKYKKEMLLKKYQFDSNLMPITNRYGFYVSFLELPEDIPLNTVKDYENYIARLNGFKQYAIQYIELMRLGIKKEVILPHVVLKGIEDVVAPHIVKNAENSLLFKPFKEFPTVFDDSETKRLSHLGSEAIMTSVVPGYQLFFDFLKQEYLPACRQSVGIWDIPQGREYYQHRVKHFTTLEMHPDEIHQLGLTEVKRIRLEMKKIIKKVNFEGTLVEFFDFLRTDERFYATSKEQLLKEVSYALKKMDGELPRFFKTLPKMPYGIREVPEYIAPKTTTAYYGGPAGDGTRAGFFYVNTYNLKSRPLYEVEALSFHEAVPGHHLQIALQQEMTDLPQFRRFGGFTSYVEGWALYSEWLALEMGFYQDPYSDFGRLIYEMWRACRLVVDTGIHWKKWSRQQAIDFMKQNTALSLHNIEAEVDRYISWPAQALAYKIGQLKISELRKYAEKELKEKFDIREFHDVILTSGSVPLVVLEDNVRKWVERVKAP